MINEKKNFSDFEIYNYKSLNEQILQGMFNIVYYNMTGLSLIDEKANEVYNEWKNNLLKNKELKSCILEDEKVYAYIQYIKEHNIVCICEIEIDKEHQGDHKTFKELLRRFVISANINKDSIVYGHINSNNKHSLEVFSNIGFYHTKNNRYEIKGKDLLGWLSDNIIK